MVDDLTDRPAWPGDHGVPLANASIITIPNGSDHASETMVESTKVGRAVAEARAPHVKPPGRNHPSIASAPVDELLDHGWRRPFPKALLHRFRTQLTDDEVDTLRSAVTDLDSERGQLAVAGLEVRRDPSALDVATSVFQRSISVRQQAAALRYIRALDPDVTLPLARSWIEAQDDRADAAAILFRLHAEARDVGLVREALARSWATRDMYNLCDLIDALGRHTDLGPFDELVSVFEEVEYSYARRRAVAVLSASDKTFADRYGVECLWDCEAPVRIAGGSPNWTPLRFASASRSWRLIRTRTRT
jgi:hypothetical protein